MDNQDVTQSLSDRFPELWGCIESIGYSYDDGTLKNYEIFEGVLRPYFSFLLARDASPARDRKLQDISSFLEDMIAAGGEVENLGYISQLESQSDAWLRRAKPFLGSGALSALTKFDAGWESRASGASDYENDCDKTLYRSVYRIAERIAEGRQSD
ncbi:MAG: hypothetical protein QNJ14_10490 [Woeseiaceae bacterium]|nr:hypothetical protein [Woeseiaceae bacterium]